MSAQRVDVYKISPELKLLVKWTAPEVFITNEYTVKSDVWLFGVAWYEIITHGHLSYSLMNTAESVQVTLSWYRMPPLLDCPQSMYDTMLECWESDLISQPSF